MKTVEGNESIYARMRVVNAAKAAGVQAIDSVFGDVGAIDGLRRWAESSRRLGYEGMGCVHPRQIAVLHDVGGEGAKVAVLEVEPLGHVDPSRK